MNDEDLLPGARGAACSSGGCGAMSPLGYSI